MVLGDMLLNTTKSATISFSLKKTITCGAICKNEASISDQSTTKLLGVVFDSHLKFSSNVDAAIEKSQPAFQLCLREIPNI